MDVYALESCRNYERLLESTRTAGRWDRRTPKVKRLNIYIHRRSEEDGDGDGGTKPLEHCGFGSRARATNHLHPLGKIQGVASIYAWKRGIREESLPKSAVDWKYSR